MILFGNLLSAQTIIDKLESLGYNGEIVLVTDGITGWKSNGLAVVTDEAEDVSKPVAEESRQLLSGLKPIVQVFGTGAYDLDKQYYSYSFGRAHLAFDIPENIEYFSRNDSNTLIAGVSYMPVYNVSLSLNYQGRYYDDNTLGDNNSVKLSMEYKF